MSYQRRWKRRRWAGVMAAAAAGTVLLAACGGGGGSSSASAAISPASGHKLAGFAGRRIFPRTAGVAAGAAIAGAGLDHALTTPTAGPTPAAGPLTPHPGGGSP